MRRVVDSLHLCTGYYSTSLFQRGRELYTESPYRVEMAPASLDTLAGSVALTLTPAEHGGVEVAGEYAGTPYAYQVPALPVTLRLPQGNVHILARPGRPAQPVKVVISGMEPTAGACLAALSTEVPPNLMTITPRPLACMVLISFITALILLAPAARAEERATTKDAERMVRKAIEYVKKEGKEKALQVFSDPKGAFTAKVQTSFM